MRLGFGVAGIALLLLVGGCGRAPDGGRPASKSPPATAPASVKYKEELLDLAMEAATAIPLQPHIKDRSRAQGEVVAVALQLDLLPAAMAYAEKISDWRRGEAYGDLAIYHARQGKADAAMSYARKAELISSAQGLEEWRRDAIRVKLAQTQVFLKNDEEARRLESSLGAGDLVRVGSVRATESDDATFEVQLKSMHAMAGGTSLDATQSALAASLRLYDRFYGDSRRRTDAEQTIRRSWLTLPIFLRIEFLLNLADAAIRHQDSATAQGFVKEAEALVKGATWRIEDITPLSARLVQYGYRAGLQENAGEALKGILAKYQAEKEQMLNIERVTALLPVAEAYLITGDRSGALGVYALTAEESVVNPNSRPRALDLAAICRAMALAGCEPDSSLWARLGGIRKGLSDPW
jgi:hypothetical protein